MHHHATYAARTAFALAAATLLTAAPFRGALPPTTNGTSGTNATAAPISFAAPLPALPVITSPLTATGTASLHFSYTITADNTPTSFSATNLPAGLAIDTATGCITGTFGLAVSGTFNIEIAATNTSGTTTATLVLTVKPHPPIGVSDVSAVVTVGEAFTYQAFVSGDPTANYTANGLPPGFTINPASGLITGTSTAAGTYGVSITITGASGVIYQRLTVTIPAIITEPHTALVTLAGTPGYYVPDTDGPAATAVFYTPTALATDSAGNLYIAETYSGLLRRLDPNNQVTTFTNVSGTLGFTDDPRYSGSGFSVFCEPYALAISPSGATLYVADCGDDTVRAIDLATNKTTTLDIAGLKTPVGLAADAVGNLYIAHTDTDTFAITKVVAATGAQTTIFASGPIGYYWQSSLALGPDGATLYLVVDSFNAIYAFDLATKQFAILAGDVGPAAAVDGTPSDARFNSPSAIATDTVGNLYIADTGNNLIRKIAVNTHAVTTLAGTPGIVGSNDGNGSQAQLYFPGGIAISDAGDIYIADTYNNTIRVLQVGPAIVRQPASQTVKSGASASFTVVASGAPNPAYQWFHDSAAIASATTATYNIPSVATADAGSYTVTLTNIMNTVTSATATLTVSATLPPSSGGNNGSGGGGALSPWWLGSMVVMLCQRLRRPAA